MTWNRRQFKTDGKRALKKNYWFIVAVVFVLSFVGVEQGSSAGLIHQTTDSTSPDNLVTKQTGNFSNYDTLMDTLDHITDGKAASGIIYNLCAPVLKTVFDTCTSSVSFLFKFIGSGQQFFLNHKLLSGLLLIVATLGSIVWNVLILNLLKVGKKRFFMENRVAKDGKENRTRISRVFFLFHRGKIENAVVVMFFRDLYIFLWTFTIIGGFIKRYEYRMIPYILAENPYTPRHEAFRLSREMTHGYKWKLFVLDISFILWRLTEFITLGLSNTFFVSPYCDCTNAEAFFYLRKNAMEQKMPYYEWFNVRSFDLWKASDIMEKEENPS